MQEYIDSVLEGKRLVEVAEGNLVARLAKLNQAWQEQSGLRPGGIVPNPNRGPGQPDKLCVTSIYASLSSVGKPYITVRGYGVKANGERSARDVMYFVNLMGGY